MTFKNCILRQLIVALVAVVGLSHAAEREYAISGAVYRGNEPDLGLSDLWLAALSKQPTLKVLDRAHIRTILGELSLTGVDEDSVRQVRLGGLLGVEYFAWLKVYDDQVLLEIVEATTGRGLAIISRSVAKGQFPEILPELAGQAVHVIDRPPITPLRGAPAIAFSNPFFSTTNAANQVAVDQIIAGLSKSFLNSGITVLPRRFVADTIQERWRQEKGLAVEVAGKQKFLGADYVLNVAIDTTNSVEITMVEVATGRRMGKKEMPSLDEVRAADGMKELNQWMMGRLTPILEQATVLPTASTNNTYYAAPEILKSLYAGMVLHNQGRYLDALPLFMESASCKDYVFDETDAWINSCYRSAGFPEIVDELTNVTVVATSKIKTGISLCSQSEPGVILLGVSAAMGLTNGVSERISMFLIDGLHEALGKPVLASEDIAGLRDEYDLLLGLDKVKGTTWRHAPPILVQNEVTAHLEREGTGVRLRLCLINNSNPALICDVVTSLPDDCAQWQPLINKAAKELLARSKQGSNKWAPPKAEFLENYEQLLSQLKKSFSSWSYLKALSLKPDLMIASRYACKAAQKERGDYWRLGIEHWALRVLPEGHPDRPMLEFSITTSPMEARWLPSVDREFRPVFQAFADRYPAHIVGLYSRYNLLLIDMTPANLADTQVKISRLVAALEPFKNKQTQKSIDAIRAMDELLRCALGLPGGKLGDIFNEGLIAVNGYSDWGGADARSYYMCLPYYQYGSPHLWPNSPEQVIVDLAALHILRNTRATGSDKLELIPASFFREIIEKNGADSVLARYAIFRYFRLIDKKSPEEELRVVCPVFASSVCEMAKDEPDVIMNVTVERVMDCMKWWPNKPIFADAARRVRQTLQGLAQEPLPGSARTMIDESWKVGPLIDTTWLSACDNGGCNNSEAAVMEYYYPYINRLHELYDGEVKSHALCRLYCRFATSFFRVGRYDLAEPLLEQIVSWKDYKNRRPDERMHAQTLYLLALLKQREGDSPSALRLAKDVINYIDENPENEYLLFKDVRIDGIVEWRGSKVGSLKAATLAFIKNLRENPRMEFTNPLK